MGYKMRICGVELKANNIIFSVIEIVNEEIEYLDVKIKKLTLEDDENQTSIKEFKNLINQFISENNIEKIIIKKRAKKGNFAGGAITFKIESLIQLSSDCEVVFISSQAITKYTKNNDIIFPKNLNKYQEQAFLSALIFS
jgi:hypothetical protein